MTIRVKQLGTTFVYETHPTPYTPIAVGGINGSVQYNNNGVFGGSSDLTFLNSFLNVTGSLLVVGSSYVSGSLAQGTTCAADGPSSHAEGLSTNAGGGYSHAEGSSTGAPGDYAHAEGHLTIASGDYSHAEGYASTASANYAHAEGNQTTASGLHSHAEGELTTASGRTSHAEGYQTTAFGMYSHSEGYQNAAKGFSSHAEGLQTFASGSSSHAEGLQTYTSGSYSHAEGEGTVAFGYASHAEGYYTIASGSYQLAIGQYNKRDNASSLFVIGNGTGDANAYRSDVVRVEFGGLQVTGSVQATFGLSGSLTQLANGTSYLVAGTNVTISSASNGQVTISAAGGAGSPGGSDTYVQFNDGGSSFGGDSGLTYNKNTDTLSVVNVSMVASNDQTFQLKDNSAGALNVAAGSDNKWTFNTGNGAERLGFWDGVRASFGDVNDPDLNIQHDGTNSTITNKTGQLILSGANGLEVTGSTKFAQGLSGSLTRLIDGTSYLVAGTNVTIASSSNGQITISSTGGGGGTPAGSDKEIQFNSAGSFGSSTNLTFDYGTNVLSLTGSFGAKGNIVPDADTTYTLGTSDKRWGHVYTGDLHLRNDRGDWTIVEERDYLCVVNNITGKKYKMMLQPLDD
jgi:hypothetical protein